MRIFIVSGLLILSLSLNAQKIFPEFGDNPKWTVERSYFWIPQQKDYFVYTTGEEVELFSIIGTMDSFYLDTLNTYIEVLENNVPVAYYRIKDQKVYMRTDIFDFLIYDFDMKINDTTHVGYNPSDTIYAEKIIKNSEGILTNQSRTFEFSTMRYQNYFREMNWIKTVGSDEGPFYPIACMFSGCEISNKLITFEMGGEVVYDLSVTLSSNESEKRPPFVYQNLENSLKITSNNNQNYNGYIFNLSGVKAMNVSLTKGENEFDISQLEKGIYFLALIKDNSIVSNYKFVKSH